MIRKYLLTCLIITCLLPGCSFLDKILEEEDTTVGLTAAQLYNEGKEFLNLEDFNNAIKYFEVLESRFPFGKYSTQAMLDLSYAYYASNKRDTAIIEINRFIRLYPNHPEVSYAYYLRALANFDKDANVVTRFFGYDPSRYDVTALKESFNDFSIVVNRYPNTKYADDSLNRLVYIRNQIARSELYIAEYYHKRSAHVAAVERIKYMLENYGGTPSTERGLLILIDSYNSLNMRQLAFDAARVLKRNYPEYKIEEINRNILVSKINTSEDQIDLDSSGEDDSWYNIFNIFN
tara:strand:+ start:679 stop:1551 length:873 start_codon:yes stop_codon:yes gene_type:complete